MISKNYFIVVLSIFSINIFSQNKSIDLGLGFWSKSELFEGYTVSGQMGFDINKYLEVSPVFSFGENFSIHDSTVFYYDDEFSIGYEGEKPKDFSDISFLSLDILLLVKPLKLFVKNESKSEIIIGSGIGYKSYRQNDMKYDNFQLTQIKYKKTKRFEPYFLKADYNYYFSNSSYIGFDISINRIDGEGLLIYGLKYGLKI